MIPIDGEAIRPGPPPGFGLSVLASDAAILPTDNFLMLGKPGLCHAIIPLFGLTVGQKHVHQHQEIHGETRHGGGTCPTCR